MSNSCSSSTSGNPKDQRSPSKSVKIPSDYTTSIIRKAINEKLLKNVAEQKKGHNNKSKPANELVTTSTLTVSTSVAAATSTSTSVAAKSAADHGSAAKGVEKDESSAATTTTTSTTTLPDSKSKIKDNDDKSFM